MCVCKYTSRSITHNAYLKCVYTHAHTGSVLRSRISLSPRPSRERVFVFHNESSHACHVAKPLVHVSSCVPSYFLHVCVCVCTDRQYIYNRMIPVTIARESPNPSPKGSKTSRRQPTESTGLSHRSESRVPSYYYCFFFFFSRPSMFPLRNLLSFFFPAFEDSC